MLLKEQNKHLNRNSGIYMLDISYNYRYTMFQCDLQMAAAGRDKGDEKQG